MNSVVTNWLLAYPQTRRILFEFIDWRDRRQLQNSKFGQMPPASLRYRVHGDLNLEGFLESGKQICKDIKNALEHSGIDFDEFHQILDFGCGCGRTLLWLVNEAKSANLFGTDIDGEAVGWCRSNLMGVSFTTNDALPPLPHPSKSFDFVYAISVFTHLNKKYQFLWLEELKRIIKPGGYILISVHGSYYWKVLEPNLVEEIKSSGFVHIRNPKPMDGIFPDWYQTTYHSPAYIKTQYSKFFEIITYVTSGLDSCQDIVLLQKRK